VADETAVGLLACDQARGALARIVEIARLAGGALQLHQRHQRGVVVDDVFLAVGAVLRVELAQVGVGALGVGQVLGAVELAVAAALPGQHRSARERGDGHAAAGAEGRAIQRGVGSGRAFVAGDHAHRAGRAPLVEHRGVEITVLVENAVQIVRAPERFVLDLRLQAMRGEQGLARVRAIGQHPRCHRRLLRIEMIGVAQVREVLALVAAGVLPARPRRSPGAGFGRSAGRGRPGRCGGCA
ncbi:hypothetical protein CATMIT_01953, partial [Catenibacterium mitsuokai DSM 15897]